MRRKRSCLCLLRPFYSMLRCASSLISNCSFRSSPITQHSQIRSTPRNGSWTCDSFLPVLVSSLRITLEMHIKAMFTDFRHQSSDCHLRKIAIPLSRRCTYLISLVSYWLENLGQNILDIHDWFWICAPLGDVFSAMHHIILVSMKLGHVSLESTLRNLTRQQGTVKLLNRISLKCWSRVLGTEAFPLIALIFCIWSFPTREIRGHLLPSLIQQTKQLILKLLHIRWN